MSTRSSSSSSSSSRSSSSSSSTDFSTSTSNGGWSTSYIKIPRKRSLSIKFMAYATGAPSNATILKKKTKDSSGYSSVRSSTACLIDPEVQMFWVKPDSSRRFIDPGGRPVFVGGYAPGPAPVGHPPIGVPAGDPGRPPFVPPPFGPPTGNPTFPGLHAGGIRAPGPAGGIPPPPHV